MEKKFDKRDESLTGGNKPDKPETQVNTPEKKGDDIKKRS